MSAGIETTLDTQRSRLLQLIDYCRKTTTLRSRPVARVEDHRSFSLYEHEIQCLPGIKISIMSDDDEVWLVVDRLHETGHLISLALLAPWVNTSMILRLSRPCESISTVSLILAGTHRRSSDESQVDKPAVDPFERISLDDYDRERVRGSVRTYLDARWRPWAQTEAASSYHRVYSRLLPLSSS